MPRLEDVANIVLRVPSILVLDLLYKCDIDSFTEHLRAKNEDMLFKYKYVIWNLYYLGHVINVVMLLLPLRHIIKVYLYILTTLLFYVGHQISKDYVHGEVQYGYDGALYLDSQAFNRFVSSLTSQVILSTLCAFLMKTRKVWLFSAHLLPLLARLCAMPHNTLLLVNSFSTALTGIGVAMFLLSNLFVPYRLARAACSELLQLEVIELYRLLAVTISLWNQFAVPVLFSVFWSVLFVVQLCSYSMTNNTTGNHEGVLFFLLTSVSECCVTPYSLLGLTSVVSYLGLGLLNLTKFYLGGYTAVQNDNVMHRQVRSAVTLSREASGRVLVETVLGEELVALQEADSGVQRLGRGEPWAGERSALWLGVQSLAFTLVTEPHENLLLAEGTLKSITRHCLEHLRMLGTGSEVLLKSDRIDVLLHRLLPHGQLLFLNHRFTQSLEKELANYMAQ